MNSKPNAKATAGVTAAYLGICAALGYLYGGAADAGWAAIIAVVSPYVLFYIVALIFLIFDVEVTFLFPWAVVFKELREAGFGLFLFAEAFLFLLILGVGFIYCWRKGDLDWVKATTGRAVLSRERSLGGRSPGEVTSGARSREDSPKRAELAGSSRS